MDKHKVVHDLALIHAQAKYREFFELVAAKDRQFNVGISELCNFYETAVTCIAPQIDDILECYLDDDGNSYIKD
ncbi:MAG: hypothetical protein VB035_09965 [Candidatus Fimivivens sp.]|nr:hypothetical protein [Candidatus Fimivivens sp.]